MTISLLDLISLIVTVIMFVWAMIERSKRMPLWWTLKGLEQSSMSSLALYDELRGKYIEDERDSIPMSEFIAHLDNAYGHWRSQRELIIGIRKSVNNREKQGKKSHTG